MELKNIILIVIAILVIVLVGVGIYVLDNGHNDLSNVTNALNNTDKNATNTTVANNTTSVNKTADNSTNKTVGDNSPRNDTNKTNKTYKVYNPQSDSYVTVIGEKYDSDVNRWYTYDVDGVRYYNTRINH